MSNRAKDEYEIQIYKFSIREMQEDTETIIMKRTCDVINSLFRTLAKQDLINENDTCLDKIRQQIMDNISNKIKNDINALHKKFDEYLSIPDNVVLVENIQHEKYCNGNYDVDTIRDKIAKLEVEFLQNILFRKKLEVELIYHKEMDTFLADEEAMIGLVKSILIEGSLINKCRNEENLINKLKQINESLLKHS